MNTLKKIKLPKSSSAKGKTIKSERIQLRIDAYSREILQKAADYSDKPLGQFVVANALDAAEQIIGEREQINLSEADWNIFFDALENPPKPNRKLKAAFKNYFEINP